MKFNVLQDELRQAGANAAEVSELSELASTLTLLKPRQARATGETRSNRSMIRTVRPYLAGAFGFALIMLPILFSLTVQPTSWIYPVQKIADSAAVSVHPQYRAAVMMRRSEQVNSLVASHADTHIILATLYDYTYQAKRYEALPHTNYAAFEYCETNLKQAASIASPKVKQAIQASLGALVS